MYKQKVYKKNYKQNALESQRMEEINCAWWNLKNFKEREHLGRGKTV